MIERFRLTYEKINALRYISHLDMQKVWTRILFRASLPIAYTQGFHPTPKMAWGWPLALGWSGTNELMDIWLDPSEGKSISSVELCDRINRNSPDGLIVRNAEEQPVYDPSLTVLIQSAKYQLTFPPFVPLTEIEGKMTELLARPELIWQRRTKSFDMKPLIEQWNGSLSDEGRTVLFVQMTAKDSAMGRPDELASLLGFDPFTIQFTRTGFLLE